MKNAFTVDLEDWYQGIELPFDDWGKHENRIATGTDKVLELLEKHQVKATFFTLGWVAEQYPELVKKVAGAGHELGSHTYSHEKVYNQSKEAFREEISRTKKLLEDVSGQAVVSHRSPFFSITNKSLWALEVLREEGFTIDCSISPIKTWRYGISTCPDDIFNIKEIGLTEFPVSRFRFFKKNWAIGGAYFRLFPYRFTATGLNKRLKAGQYNMFYIHPWEYDAQHPVVKMEWKAKITHYTNLSKTYNNTMQLLNEFEFDTVSNVIDHYRKEKGKLPDVSLAVLKD